MKPRIVRYDGPKWGKLNVPDQPPGEIFKGAFWWDVDHTKLDWRYDSYFIVSRILNRTISDSAKIFSKLEKIYPIPYIKIVALDSVEIRGNEKIEELGKRYWIKKSKFRNWIKDIHLY